MIAPDGLVARSSVGARVGSWSAFWSLERVLVRAKTVGSVATDSPGLRQHGQIAFKSWSAFWFLERVLVRANNGWLRGYGVTRTAAAWSNFRSYVDAMGRDNGARLAGLHLTRPREPLSLDRKFHL